MSKRVVSVAWLVGISTMLFLIAAACYGMGSAYGASWQEWDDHVGAYHEAERPGAFLVIAVSVATSLMLCTTAAMFILLAFLSTVQLPSLPGRNRPLERSSTE